MSDALWAGTVTLPGHHDDRIEAYLARPEDVTPRRGGVVVIHHMPGYDEATKEMVRRFAAHGYARSARTSTAARRPAPSPDDAAAFARAPAAYPTSGWSATSPAPRPTCAALPAANGKVGVIGLLLGRPPVVAGRLLAPPGRGRRLLRRVRHRRAAGGRRRSSGHQLIGPAGELSCPLLGLFGDDDKLPSPEQVAELGASSTELGKPFEFHFYEGAGHALLRGGPARLPAGRRDRRLAADLDFYGRTSALRRPEHVHLHHRAIAVDGSAKGRAGWFAAAPGDGLLRPSGARAAEHTLNIDFADPAHGPSARVALELTDESARALVAAILAVLDQVPADLLTPAPAGA